MTRVVVIGGGLAGITAALDCAAQGASVTLLEARGRLGGAAYSFSRDGLRVDNGQHVFLRCCTNYIELLERIGATSLVHVQSKLSIPVLAPGRTTAWLERGALPAPLHLAASLLKYPFLSARERISIGIAMQALARVDPDDPSADDRSFGAWLRDHGQSTNAIETMWELISTPTVNLRADDASLAQSAYVFQQGLLKSATSGDVGYATVPLGEIHDVAARRALAEAGVSVRLRTSANVVEHVGTGFEVGLSGQPTLAAEAVVVAVPPARAARLLPASSRVTAGDLLKLGTSPIVNLHLIYDRQILALPFAATVRSPVQWIFDRTASAGLESGQYLAVSLSAADAELEMTVAELQERFLPAIAEVLPAACDAELKLFFVTREHAATFRAAPGSRALRPGPCTAVPGLVLAGAWTDTGWPATMEGAVRSGHAAASVALEGLPATPAHREPAVVAA